MLIVPLEARSVVAIARDSIAAMIACPQTAPLENFNAAFGGIRADAVPPPGPDRS